MSQPTGRHDNIDGKVIVVTGAGSGFGRLLTTMCAARGATVVATDVDEAAVQQTVAGVDPSAGSAVAMVADVTVRADLEQVVARTVERFGRVDVMVNNAGIMPLAFFADHAAAADAWDRAVDINLKGVLNGISAVYDQMIGQGRGHIVNIASIYGNGGTAGSGVYSATKAAVIVLSDALRVEAQGRIKVTVVRPTGILGTGLAASVVNPAASVGITGQNSAAFGERVVQFLTDSLPEGLADRDDIRYWAITPEDLVREVVHAIDQPWGIDIGDITVRASGEDYVL